ncbi:MAG TPA: hypothetical protein VFG68_03745 [Fimbriiglobus sp.]|nr:hypothetical protein [Fimbriiglobus sp.]
MQLYCPSCQATFAAAPRCPRCGDRLVTPAESFSSLSHKVPPPPDIVRTTTAGRITIGCALALGLFIGLREWGLAVAPDPSWWNGAVGVLLTVVLRAAGAAVGGLLAGSGRPGMTTGAAVGLICGGLYMTADAASDAGALIIDGVVWAGLAVASALAGAVGGRMWPPPAQLPDPNPTASRHGSSLASLVTEGEQKKSARPIAWGRLGLALILLVAAVIGADAARQLLKRGSAGLLEMGGPAQAPLVDVQLAAIGVVVAGAVAGASTGAGLRHGVIAGFLGALAVLGLTSANLASVQEVVEGVLWVYGLPTDGSAGGQGTLAVGGSVFALTALAGWFGSQLFPVLASKAQLTRLAPT